MNRVPLPSAPPRVPLDAPGTDGARPSVGAGTASSLSPTRGIVCMIGGVALASMSDAIMKWLSAGYPIGEILSVRGVFFIAPILLLIRREGGFAILRVKSKGGQAWRALLTVISIFMFMEGLRQMALADATAVTLTQPLFVTALAPLLLREHVGWRRWLAVAIGFAGVVVMIRPTGDAIAWAALWPLGAALLAALRDLVTRRNTLADSSVATLLYSTLATALTGLATLPFGWLSISAFDLALMACAGLLLGVGHYLLIETFRWAEAAVVAPFLYMFMVWAVIIGYVVWGDIPDQWVAGGAVLVIGSGLYILRREVRLRARRRAAESADRRAE